MGELIRKLKRVHGSSADELRVRGLQTLAVLAERTGLPRSRPIPGPASARLEQFRARVGPQLSPAFHDRSDTVAELRRRFGPTHAALVERADRIAHGRFDLLGMRDVSFGSPIDWHLDPLSGSRTSLAHWTRFARTDPKSTVDRKLVWELNRHQHLVVLGRAYWLTEDERYADTFAAQLSSWLDANPPRRGVNWSSSLEVALRAISWTWALHFFRDAPQLTPVLFHAALEHLQAHGGHVETHLSTYSSPNTHLTGEGLALVCLGTVWPELRGAARWRATGLGILLSALDSQVHADGVHFERSTAYHRYTVEFYSHLLALSSANGGDLPAAVRDRLGAMLDYLLAVSRPDGTLPLLGDDDGGRLLPLDERPYADVLSTLASGGALLTRGDLLGVAGEPSEAALWLLGPMGLRACDLIARHPPARTSAAFHQGGVYVMRDSWSATANVLTISCGTSGSAHAHADALAFDLSAVGRPILTDAGTYSYVRGREHADEFRTTAAHNTVMVDGLSASVPSAPFGWSHVARCSLRGWSAHPRFDFFEGAHDGYRRLPDPVQHVRSVLSLEGRYWVIRDRLEAAGTHRYELRFHFAPGAHPALFQDDDVAVVRERPPDAPGIEIVTFGARGSWALSTGYVSQLYGARTGAAVASFTATGSGPQELITFMFPRAAREPAAAVREVAATGGHAFEVLAGRDSDTLLISSGAPAHAGGLDSDFELTWACADELVLVNGTRISVGSEQIVRTPGLVAWAYARVRDGRWTVETACVG